MQKFENFVGPSYTLGATAVDAQSAVNFYPEVVESGSGKPKIYYRTTPGLVTFATATNAPQAIRCLWSGGGRCFVVSGNSMYEMSSGGAFTLRGTMATDATPAQIFPNNAGTMLFIVSAGGAYYDAGAGVFSAPVPADPDISGALPGGVAFSARSIAVMDGYFIAAKHDSKKFFISALNDATTWSSLDYGVKEGYPDNITRILTDHQNLWLFGDETTEVWYNAGDESFPFKRRAGMVLQMGSVARWSVVNLIDGPGWLGGNAQGQTCAYMAAGYKPQRISTFAVEAAWASYATVADAIGYVYTEDGHTFWQITFPTGNATWDYDLSTNMWHQRGYLNAGAIDRHRGRAHTFVFNQHLVGDHTNGNIYIQNSTVYVDAGSPIRRERAAPHLSDNNQFTAYGAFVLEIQDNAVAYGVATTLESSKDGGVTWGTPRTADTYASAAGGIKRLIWRRLGVSRDRIFRIRCSAASPLAIVNAYLETGAES